MTTLETARHLTANIKDISAKLHLRPVLEAELMKLGHSAEDVKVGLDKLFKVTVH